MEAYFFCGDCGSEHTEPAEALLGHFILCLDCELRRGFDCWVDEVRIETSPIAA